MKLTRAPENNITQRKFIDICTTVAEARWKICENTVQSFQEVSKCFASKTATTSHSLPIHLLYVLLSSKYCQNTADGLRQRSSLISSIVAVTALGKFKFKQIAFNCFSVLGAFSHQE